MFIFRITNYSRFYLAIFSVIFSLYFYFIEKSKKELRIYITVAILVTSVLTIYSMNTDDTDAITESEEEVDRVQRYLGPNNYIGKFIFGNDYVVEKYSICCSDYSHDSISLKENVYLKSINENLIYINGYGDIFYTNKKVLLEEKFLELKHINSNFNNLISNKNIFLSDWESVKDIEIINNKIYLSVEEVEQNCISNAILEGEFNLSKLNLSIYLKIMSVFQEISKITMQLELAVNY